MYDGKHIRVGDRVVRTRGQIHEGRTGIVTRVEQKVPGFNHLAITFDDPYIQPEDLQPACRWHSRFVELLVADNIPEEW